MSGAVIEAKGLTKRYGSVTAVDGLDLSVNAGEVFGILGPNGSGKTTTILMILGLTDVTSGTVRVVGLDPTRDPLGVKRVVGYMPDTVGYYENLSARENLLYTGRLARIPSEQLEQRIENALKRVRLADVADRRAAALSRGMRQRLGLAEILIKEPRIAILDEPTNGLDPHSAHEFLELVRELKSDGMTIILSSHLLERVQESCDRVALFHRGRVVLNGTVHDLATQVLGSGYRIEVLAGKDNLERSLQEISGVHRVVPRDGGGYLVEAEADIRSDIAAKVAKANGALLGLALKEPSLDEVYNRYFEEVRDAA